MNNNFNTVNISTVTILKVLLVILAVWFLWAIRDIILLFLISVIIASAMDPLADYLGKKKIPRALSVLLVYILFLGIFGLVVALLIPPITQQFQVIAQSNFYGDLQSRLGGLQETLSRLGINETATDSIKSWAGNISSGLFNTTKNIVNGFVAVFTVLVVSFYLSAEENGTKNFIKHLVPFKKQAYVVRLVTQIQRKMGHWVLGQMALSAVIFGLTYLGLTFLKIEFALVLALIAGLLEVIPYLGPILALIPALFFAFLQNPALALGVLILYVVIQQLENHLLVPVIMSKSVGLNPVLVILGILIGGSLGGVLGAIIAVPILGGLQVFLQDLFSDADTEPAAE